MKHLVSKLSTLLIATALCTACKSDDNVLPTDNEAIHISTSIADPSMTGGSADDKIYAPDNGTALYLYYNEMGSTMKAEYNYVADTKTWGSNGTPLYWDNLSINDAGIYPFFAASPQTPADNPAVVPDQNAKDAYKTSDQLIAYAYTTKRKAELNLDLHHVLSQLNVTMTSPAGSEQLDLSRATLTISGAALSYTLAYSGTVTTEEGTTLTVPCAEAPVIATAKPDDAGTAVPALTPQTGIRTSGSLAEASTANYIAVVPPQTGSLTFTFTIGGKQYTQVAKDLDLKSGQSTQFMFTARKSGVELSGIKLTDWIANKPITADITVTLDGNASGTGDGTAFTPADGTEMNIWKKSSDAEADRVSPHTYTMSGSAWTTSNPIYVDDTNLAADRFYATIENGKDAITNVTDLIGAGPAQMGAGKLNFGFTHLMAQLAVNVKKAADFPADIDLSNATVTTPEMKPDYTLSYAAADPKVLTVVAKEAGNGTETFYPGLATGVTTDASAGNGTATTEGETPYLVVPQTLGVDAQFILAVGDKNYTATLADGITLEAGKKNVLTLTLHPTGVTIDGITLADWTTKDTTGDGSVDGVTNVTTALTDVDQAGTLHLVATTDGSTPATNGHGIYPVTYDASKAAINEDDSRYQPILWDHLAASNNIQAAKYTYRALFVPSAYRHGAKADDNYHHELDYLTATSAATPWGTAPTFSGENTKLTHALAQLTVVLANSDGTFTDTELESATVTTISKAESKANPNEGTLIIDNLAAGSEKTVTLLPAGGSKTRNAIIAPQQLQNIVITINIGGDDKTYTVKPAAATALTAGGHLTLTATLKRTETGFTIGQTEWEKTELKGGDITVDE